MGRIPVREVRCEDCSNVFKSSQKNPQCSNCGGRNVKPVLDESTEKQKKTKDNVKLPDLPIMAGLDLESQNNMQYLMNLGVGKSSETIIRKALQNMRLNFDGKGGKIMKEEKSTEETMDDIAKRRALSAEAKMMEAEAKKITEPNGKPPEDDIDREFRLANLKKLQAQGVSPIEQMMAFEMFKNLRGNGSGANQEVEMLRNELKEMKENEKYENLRKEMAEVRALLLETTKNKTGDTQTGLITQMSTIFANRDTDIAKLRAEIDATKRDTNNQILQEKLNRLEQALGGKSSELESFKNTFVTVRELSKEFGPAPAKKSGMEAAQELIGSTISAIQKPILEPIGQAMAQSIANQQQPQTQPVQQAQSQSGISEAEINSDLVNISTQ